MKHIIFTNYLFFFVGLYLSPYDCVKFHRIQFFSCNIFPWLLLFIFVL